jgi:two-component system, cell cycle response regulator
MPADRKPPTARTPPTAPDLRRALLAGRRKTVVDDIARLKQQLRDNERIWAGFRCIEVRMIGAHSLRELVAVATGELPRAFPSVDAVTLACFDPEYEMARMLESNGGSSTASDAAPGHDPVSSFVAVSQESLTRLFGAALRPRLGPCDPSLQALLFPEYPGALGSVALAPLVLRGQLIGALNQGSLDPAHFTAGTATDLLEHLAAVASMCLDNAVSHERLRVYGLIDPLTGVANRRFFERRVGEEIERWLRRREPLVYMLVDIDHFKQVNDQHGHRVGDQVLQQVAQLLGRDLRGADLLARYGGEEFMLLLPNTTAAQGAAIGQRLCNSVARHAFEIEAQRPLAVTISIGIACLDAQSADAAQPPAPWLFQQADAALYQAKQAGRNRIVFAAPA